MLINKEMTLRKFVSDKDFDIIKNCITDPREHTMWCANIIQYPINVDRRLCFL